MSKRWMQMFATMGLIALSAAPSRDFAATQPAGWKTYRSSDYGFTIDYARNGSFTAGYQIEPQGGMMPVCGDTSAACFEYIGHLFDNTLIVSQGVSVNILRDRVTAGECDDVDGNDGPVTSVVIHGTRFYHGEFSDAAGGRGENVNYYRAFHQHVCFEITLIIVEAGIGLEQYDEEGLHCFNEIALRAVQGKMNRMLHSFTFAGRVRDGAVWNRDRESGCGGSFEVPADTRVETVIPDSVNAIPSPNVGCALSFVEGDRVYTIAQKWNFENPDEINEWLSTSGFPGIGRARNLGNRILEYRGSSLAYFVIHCQLILFSVTNTFNQSPVRRDRVFTHLVNSFHLP